MFTHNGIKYILSNGNEKDEKGKLICDLTLPTCIINNMEFPNCCLVKKNKLTSIKQNPQKSPSNKPNNQTQIIPPPEYDDNFFQMLWQEQYEQYIKQYTKQFQNNFRIPEIEKSCLEQMQLDKNMQRNPSTQEKKLCDAYLSYLQRKLQGGKNSKYARSQYKALVEKKDVKKLYKIAKEMGIKITKKRDGKTSYIKKETIVKK